MPAPPTTMRAVCAGAARRGVVVGAQVSYRDRAGFGRVARDVAFEVLRDEVAEQVATLDAIAREEGTAVRYLKPHGALYHRVTDDEEQAGAVLAGSGTLPVLGFPGSRLLALAAAAGRAAYVEGFPDRGYRDGRLIDRGEPGALLADADAIARQAVDLAGRGRLGVRARRLARRGRPRARRTTGAGGRGLPARSVPRRLPRRPDFSTGDGPICGGSGRSCGRTGPVCGRHAEPREIVGNCGPEPLALGAPAGIELSLPARRLRRAGVEKQEDPYCELARGAGRWRQAGSEGLSAIGRHRAVNRRALDAHTIESPSPISRRRCPSSRGRRGRRGRGASARTRAKRGTERRVSKPSRWTGLMKLRPVGRHALLVEVASPQDAVALAAWARDARHWPRDVVPGAETVLFDGVVDPGALCRRAGRLDPERGTPPGPGRDPGGLRRPGPRDGRGALGLRRRRGGRPATRPPSSSRRSAASRPASPTCRGSRLAVPRLATPRTRVPAGSVALAGTWCGVYPVASPGGWQIIGTTDAVLWDPGRSEPALLAPGTRVRFVAR